MLILAFLAGITIAEQPVLVITPGGFFYLQTGTDGVPVGVPVAKIVDLRGGTPEPNPDQPRPPDNALTTEIRDLAKAVGDGAGAQALALVYTQASEAVADGIVQPDSVMDAIRKASDNALGLTGSAIKWDPFRNRLSSIATERLQRGELSTPKQMSEFLKCIALGLELAADGSNALEFSVIIQVSTGTNNALGIK